MFKDSFSLLLERHQQKMLPALLADIHEDQLSFQPVAGINHPAWILGHLLALEWKIARGVLGRPLHIVLDAGWREVYGIGSAPKSDRRIYKSKEFYMNGLAETAGQIRAFIGEKSDADLDAPNPDPEMGRFFPTIAITLVAAVTHRAYHSGQLATWRKAAGLPHAGM